VVRLRQTRCDLLRAFVQVRGSPFDSSRPERRRRYCFGTKRPPVQIRPPRPAHRPLAISVSGLLHGPSNCNPTTDPRNPYLDQGGARARGAAGPASTPGSALGGPPGARRATRSLPGSTRLTRYPDRHCTWPSSRRSIVPLAGSASRPSWGRRFAMASPAWTRNPLARNRGLSGRRGRSEPRPPRN